MRFPFVLLVVTLVAAALVQVAAAQPPNILVIVTDDQRATGTLDVMPNTRAFFRAGGVRYPNAFATTPLCCPARSTILSGRYAHNTGVKSNAPPLALDMTTIFRDCFTTPVIRPHSSASS